MRSLAPTLNTSSFLRGTSSLIFKAGSAPRVGRARLVATMSSSAYKTVVLGGGNSAGYAAWEWVKRGGGEGLAIIGDEPVRHELNSYAGQWKVFVGGCASDWMLRRAYQTERPHKCNATGLLL